MGLFSKKKERPDIPFSKRSEIKPPSFSKMETPSFPTYEPTFGSHTEIKSEIEREDDFDERLVDPLGRDLIADIRKMSKPPE